MVQVKLILVGGFLGAGKTTLLARAAERLAACGLRVGLVTNDQAANLVDTQILARAGQQVKEVSGACFCCAFNKLLHVCDQLVEANHPDVIIGEPVGSCTDLSATVLQPIKKYCADRFALAPYSVLVDADRLPEMLAESLTGGQAASGTPAGSGGQAASGTPAGSGTPATGSTVNDDDEAKVRYIYRKQIEEADLIVLNKIDALSPGQLAAARALLAREFPGQAVLELSARTGAGVDGWVEQMLAGQPGCPPGQRIVPVDYDIYAAGEAALGWLNAAIKLEAQDPTDWRRFVEGLLTELQREVSASQGQIAHLKAILAAYGGAVQANIVNNQAPAMVSGDALPPSRSAMMVLNARVRTSPEWLKAAVEKCLARVASAAGEAGAAAAGGAAVEFTITELTSLRPGRPTPVHRFSQPA